MGNYQKVTKLINDSSLDENLKQVYLSEAYKLHKKCGCKLGAACLIGSFFLISVYGVYQHSLLKENWLTHILQGAGVVLLSAVLGKILGLLIAQLQLEMLNNTIKKRLAKSISYV